MDEEGVLDFLTSLEAMDLPDRIEEVNGKILSKIIEDTDYVAVLFCKYFIHLIVVTDFRFLVRNFSSKSSNYIWKEKLKPPKIVLWII